MRALGIDHGERRVGIAISDESKTLARPLTVIRATAGKPSVLDALMDLISKLAAEEGSLELIVVGVPRRLDGSANERTGRVEQFVRALQKRTPITVVVEDERLSSVEAESRLGLFHKSWRDRKELLDAASAAVILQDYLDRSR